jgi:DNA-binding transcriptional regulator GbsR (MarR family)
MDIDDIKDATGLSDDTVQLALAQLINAKLIFYKQHVGFCRYATRPAHLTFKTTALALVFAVVPCK